MNAPDSEARQREREQAATTASSPTLGLRSTSKIHNIHLDRLAMVYVRQSSPQQVLENRESRERQYALAQFAQRLGWPPDRVIIIDDDQGLSGKTADHRSGFQRLMSEVSLNHVGLVLGLELNRLSRSNKDWHQLIGRVLALLPRSERVSASQEGFSWPPMARWPLLDLTIAPRQA